MAIKRLYKSTIPSCQYFFKNGKQAAFINNRFMTAIESEIAELDSEIGEPGEGKSNHPHLYVDLNETEVDTSALSPIELIKAQVRKELLAEMAKAASTDRDMGTTAKLDPTAGMSNSKTVGEAMAGSDSAVGAQAAASEVGVGGTDPTAPATAGIKIGPRANASPQ